MTDITTVLVTGGAGYVGSVLVPKLLSSGYRVKVLDLYLYGDHTLDGSKDNPLLEQTRGDIRDRTVLEKVIPGVDAVIHLASISNDPSFDLDPELGKSINYDAFFPLVELSKAHGVQRFIFASSATVYGIKKEENVTEDFAPEPLTDYGKYKALCEEVLLREQASGFTAIIVRPATVCGYSPRLRLDLTVNILTNLAINTGRITVFGGEQKRPNIHIDDITDLYVDLLSKEAAKVAGNVFNVGCANHTVRELADIVKEVVARGDLEVVTTPTDDVRSYHISSAKLQRELGFVPRYTVEGAVRGLCDAFASGEVPDPLTDIRYYNIKTMQALKLK